MSTRTTIKTVTFRKPFSLPGHLQAFPAGQYSIETDEELIPDLSFAAYRRVLTLMCSRVGNGSTGITQFLNVDPAALDEALMADGSPAEGTASKPVKTDVPTPA